MSTRAVHSPRSYASPSRREAIQTAASVGLACLLGTGRAEAISRPTYGGTLKLTLPLRLGSLDPHDPEDLSASLLGASLFESLFSSSPSSGPYPTLAASMPERSNGRLLVELRPGLTFASGRPLRGDDVVASILRSQSFSSSLESLGHPSCSRTSPLVVSFPAVDPQHAARLLSQLRAAILPKDFTPEKPDATGPLQIARLTGVMRLIRNTRAPRGGSFLSEVTIESATVRDCLRTFETRASELGFLGSGLHQPRRDGTSFRLGNIGLVLVLPGMPADAPGALHESLARLPDPPFSALGVNRVRQSPSPYAGAATSLLVDRDEPWLRQIAEELGAAWHATRSPLRVATVSKAELRAQRTSPATHLSLRFQSNVGVEPDAMTEDLFRLASRSAPLGGRLLSPLEACRQLPLGLLGELTPYGSVAPGLPGLVGAGRLDLGNCQRL